MFLGVPDIFHESGPTFSVGNDFHPIRFVHERKESLVKNGKTFVVEKFERFEIEVFLGFVDPQSFDEFFQDRLPLALFPYAF